MVSSVESAAPSPVSDDAIADLHERLDRLRRVEVPVALESGYGIDAEWMSELLAHWRHGYDWREHEARILALPWELVDGPTPLRVVHQRAEAGAPVVLLLHGWPDSVLRFEKVLPLLSGYTVVAPALPGYPFSAPTEQRGMSPVDMADAVAAAMTELGYDRYIVSGGDIGTFVGESIMRRHGSAVSAAHFTDVAQGHLAGNLPENLDADEQAYVAQRRKWQQTEGAYAHEHSTKPATLAVALGDSPAGLLAWIGEKLWSWTDHGNDIKGVFSLDDALTWISAYWFTGAIGTSFGPYALRDAAPNELVEAPVPTVFSIFPGDLANAPRSFAERLFDVRGFHEYEQGGHFAAWERPEQFVADLEEAIALAQK